MQINITLSKKEKRHYFLYLLGMLLLSVIIISFIVLRKYANPFSEADRHSIMIMQEKIKFDNAQKSLHKQMDSTFVKILKYDPEKSTPVEENDIKVGISDINSAFKMTAATDPRKESYPQIAKYYQMYFEDKRNTLIIKNNIENFTRQYENCTVGYKDKQQRLNER